MKGIFIDCYQKDNNIVLWIKDRDKNIKVVDTFSPKIYAQSEHLDKLRKKLADYLPCKYVKKKTLTNKDVKVLEITIKNIEKYRFITKEIEKTANYAVELYNADIPLEEYYMFEKNLFPLCKIENLKNVDEVESINYTVPDFKIANIEVKTDIRNGLNTKIRKIKVNNRILEGNERDIIDNFREIFQSIDPDIVWCENGNVLLPYLKFKTGVNFNRFEQDDIGYKKGRTYFTYGKIIYRQGDVFLKGRLHFDKSSFFADNDFYGILEGARICRMRIQRTSMRSAGAAVTNLLTYQAWKDGFLIPYKVGVYERFKTVQQLFNADRGSVIFEPIVGFHTDVAELDFVSMFPSIISMHNLSPETLFCKCCSYYKVPGLHYHFCQRKRGIVPKVADFLIKRRIQFKENYNANKQKIDFLKWLLVVIFGFQAYKNKKIGCIEVHEAINAYAREIMLKSINIAESYGYKVVHGIIDSMYIKKYPLDNIELNKIGKEIYLETKLLIGHEGSYKWIVFLPSLLNKNIPVPTRYYGVLDDGSIKIRGIEARNSGFPLIVKKMQLEMIRTLAKANDYEHFKALFLKVFEILKNYVNHLPEASPEELVIRRTLSKLDYKHNIAQKMVLNQLKEYSLQPGNKIRYIIAKDNYVPLEKFRGSFDIDKYTELLVKATFSILQPVGITVPSLYSLLGKTRQLKLVGYIH